MSKFAIYSSGGTQRANGCPTFTGTYMKAGVLDYREIASPTPINWSIGDYVDYSRTGLRYYLYNIPQTKRQARNAEYGGTFVYQNVQFHDASYDFEICPFRDLVVGDNRVHFSTQPAISVFDNVAGIAERIEACLEDMFPGKWEVRVASGTEYDTLMAEEREFAVSGVSIKGVLDKVYEVWPEVGWVFSVEGNKCVLTIGGAWQNSPDSYEYGKGDGLITLSRTVANADEMANRLYVYGSNRNMLPRWYNSQDIKDKDSVDIQHLMLPVGPISPDYSGWGKTLVDEELLPDPAKAFIEDASSIAKRGLRPRAVYFDGSGDYKEIYPTIREMTIGDVRSAKSRYGDDTYVPSQIWADNERIDKVLSVNSVFDSGLSADSGKSTVQSDYRSVDETRTYPITSVSKTSRPLFTAVFFPSESGMMNVSLNLDMNGTVVLAGGSNAKLEVRIEREGLYRVVELAKSDIADNTFIIKPLSIYFGSVDVDSSRSLQIDVNVIIEPSTVPATMTMDVEGTLTFSMSRYREQKFSISLRQIGFDITEQAALGDGKTIAMRSGKCVGRSFRISACAYNGSTDTWNLDVIRSNDESLSQWFPNSDYPIEPGDEFVLLDIAMPALYVSVAEERLLATAKELLADASKERWQYIPEIDAKFMALNGRTIKAGDVIRIEDSDIVDDEGVLPVDSVTITENESNIPTYKVTTRERKKKTYSDKASVPEASSTPVTNATVVVPSTSEGKAADSFFEEDGQGGVKLKDIYAGLWSSGFMTAGGLNTGGGGGGGTIDLARMWQSLMNASTPVADNPNNKIALAHIPNVPVSHINGLGSLATMNDITTAYITDFPSAMPASDVYAWAKKVNLDINDVPTIPYSKTSGFGAAALKGVASSVVSGDSSNLVTGAAVYSAINSALSSAIKYQGITTTVLTDGATTNPIVINGESFTAHLGDVVIYGGKEFLYTGSVWQQLGDEASWALKTVQIIAGTGLTGGGTLEANRTLSLSAATIASLGKADTALQSADIYGLTINNYAGTALTTYNPIGGAASVTLTKAVVGLGNVDNTADADKRVAYATSAGSASNAGTLENHAASYFATASALSSVSNTVSALAARQNWDDIFGIDANGDVYVKKNGNVARGFYSYGFVTAGGLNPGGGGGGGTIDLARMWQALMNTNAPVADDPNNKIAVAHIPTLSIAQTTGLQSALDAKQNTITDLSTIRSRADEGHTAYGYFSSGILGTSHVPDLAISKITGLQTALDGKQAAYGFTINGTSGATYNLANFVTSSGVTSITAGTGLSGGTITSSGTIGIASGYKLPTTTEWAAKADASALAGYLPLSGGTVTDQLILQNGRDTKLILNNTYGEQWSAISFRENGEQYASITAKRYYFELSTPGSLYVNGYPVITSANIGSQNVSYATTAGSAPASDVYSWAKQPTKPSYHAGELNTTPKDYKVSYVAAGIAPYISEIGTNIFSGATTSEITVERSTDDGATWTDVTSAEAANVKNVFSGCVDGLLLVSARSHGEVGDKLRITFNPAGSTRYCQLAFIYIYYTTMGAGTTCLVEKNTYTNQNVWTTYVADAPISGWSGPNVIGMGETYFGQGDSRNRGYGLRFTFRINSVNADYDSRGYIRAIQGFTSNRAWGSPSGNSIARANVPYSFTNADRAVSFDNTVAASGFIRANSNDTYVLLGGGGHAALNTLSVNHASSAGSASSATALSTARTLWGQSFDGSANVSGAMTDVDSINGFVTFGANRRIDIGASGNVASVYVYASPVVYGSLTANALSTTGGITTSGNIVASGINAQHSFDGTTTIRNLSVTSSATFGKKSSPVDVYVRGELIVGMASSNKATTLNGTLNATGNTTIGGTLSVTGTVKTGSKYYFGDTGAYFEYVNIGTAADPVYAIHSNVGIYSDSFVSAGGLNSQSGGGAGAGLADVWNSLTGTVVDQWANTQINLSHIPVIPMAKLASDVQNAISDAGKSNRKTQEIVPVVNRCIPVDARKGMVYFFSDGLIKVKTSYTKEDSTVDMYYMNGGQIYSIGSVIHFSAGSFSSLGEGPVLVEILEDGPFDVQSCKVTKCPNGVFRTRSPRLIIEDCKVKNIWEAPVLRLSHAVPVSDSGMLGAVISMCRAVGFGVRFVWDQDSHGKPASNWKAKMVIEAFKTRCRYRSNASERKIYAESARDGVSSKERRMSYCYEHLFKLHGSCKIKVRTIVRGHKSKGVMYRLTSREISQTRVKYIAEVEK